MTGMLALSCGETHLLDLVRVQRAEGHNLCPAMMSSCGIKRGRAENNSLRGPEYRATGAEMYWADWDSLQGIDRIVGTLH